jgi:hypothetical protein
MLRELALARFPKDAEVADTMRLAEELAVQQPGDTAAFMAATKAVMRADEEKKVGEECYVSNVSIIFDAPCLFLHHLPIVSLHFVALLCIFRN